MLLPVLEGSSVCRGGAWGSLMEVAILVSYHVEKQLGESTGTSEGREHKIYFRPFGSCQKWCSKTFLESGSQLALLADA